MCMQCASTAVVAMGSAAGLRATAKIYLARWMTPRRMKVLTGTLLFSGLILSSATIGGSG